MLKFAADENFNNGIVRGVRRRNLSVDIVRIQDADLSGAAGPAILEWTAQSRRVLQTHDVTTMTRYTYDRVRQGRLMPEILEVGRHVPVGIAIDEILILAEFSLENEWDGQVRYLPLR